MTDNDCACGCGAKLGPKSASEYFATEGCQRRWNRRRAGIPAPDGPQPTVIDEAMEWLAAIAARATTPRRQRYDYRTPYVEWSTEWQQVDSAGEAVFTYTEPVARWWSWDEPYRMWVLMEAAQQSTRRIYHVSDYAAQRMHPGQLEEALKRRFGGHIPPIPTNYMR